MKFNTSDLRSVTLLIVVIAFVFSLATHILENRGLNLVKFFGDLSPNVMSGAIEIAVTVLILNHLAEERAQRNRVVEQKSRLRRELGSTNNATAVSAAKELSEYEWHNDGTTQGVNLLRADLEQADLDGFDLRNAFASYANFRNAFMKNVKAQGMTFTDADLQGADVTGIECDKDTILPNGHFWRSDVDWRMFTDPSYKNFWRAEDPRSTASERHTPTQAEWRKPRRPK